MAPTFCPNCSNALTIARIESTDGDALGENALQCRTCPYQFILEGHYFERMEMKPKQKDDVIGSMEGEGLPEVDVKCSNEKCDSRLAWMYQLQTRSADEPPTTFYKCMKCNTQWREY